MVVGREGGVCMQNLMAALALCLAGLIIWRSWWMIVVRQSPAMAARVRAKRQDDPTEAPAMPAPKAWFAPPAHPVIELKAARIRSEPAASADAPAPPKLPRGGWNPEDDAELLRLVADGTPTADIAATLGRSEKAILLRIPLLRLRQRQTEQAARKTETACR
jgi:hypothetical protein